MAATAGIIKANGDWRVMQFRRHGRTSAAMTPS
jgi:hypothetical protein